MPKQNVIFCGNSIEIMQGLPEACVDMIFADPPYNLQLGEGTLYRPDASTVNAVNDAWDSFDSLADYDRFTESWLTEARRLLKPDGTIWVIGSYHNIFRVGAILQDLGFWILNDVIWRKNNPMPNFKGSRLTNAHETLIWASRSKASRYTFNYQSLKAFNEDRQLRSDWTFPICGGKERLRDEDGKKVHSTQKPEELLYRVLLASTKENDLILDPFLGSGTSAAVAKKLRRKWIGIERDPTYVEAAQKRLAAITPLEDSLLPKPRRKTGPQVKFGNLVESGLIAPGTRLFSKDRVWSCTVLADGSVRADGDAVHGSIHQTAKELSGKPSSNGWMFWHLEQEGQLVQVDRLRGLLDAGEIGRL